MTLGFGSFQIIALIFLVVTMSYKVHSDHLGNIGQHGKKICSSCNYFQGSWVVDNHYPLYDAARCPFTKKDFNRQKNGRPADMEYLKYIWKPNSCLIPSFDAREFLMRQRGKKIMFVGDSLSYNMWQSLTCKLYTAAPNSNYTYSTESQLYTVSFLEYGVSVMFLRNEFLVDLVDTKIGRVLKLDSLSTGNLWKIADVLNFNTNHWWTHTGRAQTWDYFQVGQKIFKEMNRTQAYKIGLSTWAKWIYANINPLKTQVFYQGVSAVHYYDKELDLNAKNCQGQTQVFGATFPGPSSSTSTPGEAVVKKNVPRIAAKPVDLLDIMLLTQLRKDGHPSSCGYGGSASVDCSHWCLARVPFPILGMKF